MWDYHLVEDALARMHRIPSEVQTKAFRGKIQHFQKLGIPLNLKPGKGKKISYTGDEVFQWVLCLELAEYGVNPSTIANTIKAYWNSHLQDAFHAAARSDRKDDILLCFSPHIASAPGPPGLGEPKILRGEEALRRAPRKAIRVKKVAIFDGEAPATSYYIPQAARSALLINLSQVIRDLSRLRFLLAWKPGEPLYPHVATADT
jgi:hypothetical protein